MEKKMVINTEKFLKWIDKNIVSEYACEAEQCSKGNYSVAAEHKEARSVFEFIRREITGENCDDVSEFMEEVNE